MFNKQDPQGARFETTVLQGELTSSVVNAPMVPPEVLKELAPFVDLAQVGICPKNSISYDAMTTA